MSRSGKLNHKKIDTYEVGPHADGGGLYLLVEQAAREITRRFAFRFTDPAGKRRWKDIGPTKEVSLSQARDIAEGYRGQVRQGGDPRRQDQASSLTLGAFIEKHQARWTKDKSQGEVK